jgi:hypothetical protein
MEQKEVTLNDVKMTVVVFSLMSIAITIISMQILHSAIKKT